MAGVRALKSQGNNRPTAAEAIEAARELSGHGGDRRSENQVKDINLKRGPTAAYLAARLKRDHPDIVKRIDAGEFPSIRAAAIEAGIVKVKSARQQLEHWWGKASDYSPSRFGNKYNMTIVSRPMMLADVPVINAIRTLSEILGPTPSPTGSVVFAYPLATMIVNRPMSQKTTNPKIQRLYFFRAST